jgi:tetratricopeptide (TPR) repeat protein
MMRSVVVANLADMLFQLGRWEEVDRLLGQAQEYETAAAFRLHRVKGRLELARGRFTAAQDELELALQQSPSTLERLRPVLWLAELAIWQGRHEDAHALLARARSSWAGTNITDDYHRWQIVLQYALELRLEADCAELAHARHELAGVDEARRQAGGVIAELRRMTTGSGQAKHTLYVLVHCHPALCEAEFSRVEGRSDPDRWRTAAALWDKFPCPYEAAYTRYRQAEGAAGWRHVPPASRDGAAGSPPDDGRAGGWAPAARDRSTCAAGPPQPGGTGRHGCDTRGVAFTGRLARPDAT